MPQQPAPATDHPDLPAPANRRVFVRPTRGSLVINPDGHTRFVFDMVENHHWEVSIVDVRFENSPRFVPLHGYMYGICHALAVACTLGMLNLPAYGSLPCDAQADVDRHTMWMHFVPREGLPHRMVEVQWSATPSQVRVFRERMVATNQWVAMQWALERLIRNGVLQ